MCMTIVRMRCSIGDATLTSFILVAGWHISSLTEGQGDGRSSFGATDGRRDSDQWNDDNWHSQLSNQGGRLRKMYRRRNGVCVCVCLILDNDNRNGRQKCRTANYTRHPRRGEEGKEQSKGKEIKNTAKTISINRTHVWRDNLRVQAKTARWKQSLCGKAGGP